MNERERGKLLEEIIASIRGMDDAAMQKTAAFLAGMDAAGTETPGDKEGGGIQ